MALNQLSRPDYDSVYCCSGASDFSEVLEPIEVFVFENMYSSLEAPITDSEIHKAVKKLAGLKAPGDDGVFSVVLAYYG